MYEKEGVKPARISARSANRGSRLIRYVTEMRQSVAMVGTCEAGGSHVAPPESTNLRGVRVGYVKIRLTLRQTALANPKQDRQGPQ